MMEARPLQREEVLRIAREGYARKFPAGRPGGEPPANVLATLSLLGVAVVHMPYRGRMYEIGYVSFEDGLRLVEARVAVAELEDEVTPETARAYLQSMRTIVSMAPRYLLPVTRFRRLLWRLRLRRNPFRSATDAEVGLLLGFFLQSRMRSRVQSPAPPAGVHVPTS